MRRPPSRYRLRMVEWASFRPRSGRLARVIVYEFKATSMPITPEQIAAAQAVQHAAAHDSSACVRLVAGPGTGKSSAIEARICWLLAFLCAGHAEHHLAILRERYLV